MRVKTHFTQFLFLVLVMGSLLGSSLSFAKSQPGPKSLTFHAVHQLFIAGAAFFELDAVGLDADAF